MGKALKYPGSKWRIADRIVGMIPPHHTYCEPFFGSGAVFFRKQPSDIEIINDLDSDVVNLFRCIRQDPERLARMVMATPYSRQEYGDSFADLDMWQWDGCYGSACRFLVRCWQGHGSRNDGYKAGWKYDAVGREKMYALWDWYRLPGWIVETAERLRMVQVEHRPALDVIRRFNYSNVFMYLDPPYLLGTRNRKQYRHEMTDADHAVLLDTILATSAKVMISGYASGMYDGRLKDWNRAELQSNAEHGMRRTEVVWMNY